MTSLHGGAFIPAARLWAIAAAVCLGGAPSPAEPPPFTLTDLGSGRAYALNEHAQVVGTSNNDAVLWEDGRMVPLPSLGSRLDTARDINDAGQIVGASTGPDRHARAVLWQDGQVRDLGTLGGDHSAAYGINSAGDVAGHSYMPEGT